MALALLPGTAWVHGGVELLHSLGAVGPVGIGVALFADAARVIGGTQVSFGQNSRRSAITFGGGGRARLTAVPGWLRIDWGVDPADGTSTLSAGWVLGAPL
jgi:hypothetical protein